MSRNDSLLNRWYSHRSHSIILFAVSLLILLLFTLQEWRYAGTYGVPLDDSWIHFQFARNLANGSGFSYNSGIETPGSTGPLWVFILAGAYTVTENIILISKLAGFAFLLLCVWGVYRLSRLLNDDHVQAFFAAVLTLLAGRLFWGALSGMEIGLFTALMVWGIFLFLNYEPFSKGSYLCPVVLGLAALARPEGVLLFLIAFTVTAWSLFRRRMKTGGKQSFSSKIVGLGLYLFLFGIIILPFLLFCLKTTGRPLPNTFYAKTHGIQFGIVSIKYIVKVAFYYFKDHPLLFIFLPLGLWTIVTKAFRIDLKVILLPAWFVGLPLSNALLNPVTWHHGRYFMFLIPLWILFSVHGIFTLFRSDTISKRHLKEIALVLSLLASMAICFQWSKVYARNVDNIQQMDVRMGQWLNENVPLDAVIAASDVGAIAYFANRTIIDTDGLTTAAIIPYFKEMGRENGVYRYLAEIKPDFVVAFDREFQFLIIRSDIFKPIFSLRVKVNTILGGDRMVVYRAQWPS